MDHTLFRQYIRHIILPLYPNISRLLIRDPESKKILSGPVLFKTDSGPGRFSQDGEHVKFLDEMRNIGLDILLSLPNGTSVCAELDQFFQVYKGWCRTRTLDHFSYKLNKRILDIQEMREKRSSRASERELDEAVILQTNFQSMEEDDPDKVKLVVGLDNDDLSTMINGLPDDDIKDKPFDRAFTKELVGIKNPPPVIGFCRVLYPDWVLYSDCT